jgi:hypothetical protein
MGGGEVSGEIRCEVPERDSIDGYLDSKVSSVLFVVVVGEVVGGISN